VLPCRFVLKDGLLFYLKNPSDIEPVGIIPLKGSAVKEVTEKDKKDRKFCFKIHPKVKQISGTLTSLPVALH
jgi:hypothetical protein